MAHLTLPHPHPYNIRAGTLRTQCMCLTYTMRGIWAPTLWTHCVRIVRLGNNHDGEELMHLGIKSCCLEWIDFRRNDICISLDDETKQKLIINSSIHQFIIITHVIYNYMIEYTSTTFT